MRHLNLWRTAAACCAVLLTAECIPLLPQTAVMAANGVVINEICTKNTTVSAPNGQYYDYIELYNPGSSAVSVGGYGLSDDEANPLRYVLPADASVPANGFYVIYCGVAETDGIVGASFGLSKKGETVCLSDPNGSILELHQLDALNDDTAFGRVPDGSDTFAYLNTLSPGAPNPTDSVDQLAVTAPAFSQESGFYASDFDLTLSADAGTTIYYTIDGSDPTPGSQQYNGAIRVYDKSADANVYAAERDITDDYEPPSAPVDKAMIVRAVAEDASGNLSKIITKTYFIGYSANDYTMNMRVISLVTDPNNLFDYETGIYVRGKVFGDWLSSPEYSPMIPNYEQPANYTQSGREWERPAHITVFESGSAAYSAEVGIRMHGGATRSAVQKSFNLYARSDYGTAKLEYDFFGGALTDVKGKVIDSFDKLTLRNGGNDEKTKIRDRLNQEMVADRAFGTQAQTECVVFLDGEFWGTYNIVEKLGKEYISDHFDVKEKDVCMIKTDELSDGSEQGWADYESLKNLAQTADYRAADTYAQLSDIMDMQSFADYMAVELILGNSDFGDNNYCLWKTETVDASRVYADGKWRFLLFDTEYGQGLYGQSNAQSSVLQSLRQKNCWISQLFFGLLDNAPEFQQMFARTYFDLCNENYKPARVTERLSELEQLYTASMLDTYDRFSLVWSWGWGALPSASGELRNEISDIRSFWNERANAAKQQLLNEMSNAIGRQTFTLTLTNPAAKGSVQLNTLTLDCADGQWSGTYPSECDITLQAMPKAESFSHWEISGAEIVSGSENADTVVLRASGSNVTVEAVYGEGAAYTKADAQKLLDHLLTKTTLSKPDAQRYDLDGSGTLTAKDLTLLKHRI